MRPLDIVGIDRRLLVPLAILGGAALFTRVSPAHNLLFTAITVVVYFAAKVQWETNPTLLDEIFREVRLPRRLVADEYLSPGRRPWWFINIRFSR